METLDRQAMFIHDSRNAVLLGEAKGLERGIELGKREEKKAIARSLLNKLPTAEIADITGLSVDEIAQLNAADSQN
jgi:predicted transposase/invertase (TIGR01784 family)